MEIIFLWFLNLMDCFFTMFAVINQYGKEVNPLMAYCLSKGMLVFFIVKMTLTTLCCFLLKYSMSFNKSKLFINLLHGLTLLYFLLFLWHLRLYCLYLHYYK